MNVLGDFVIDYVDEVLITSPDIESMLEALTKAGFSYEMFFLKAKVEFLCFEIDADHISSKLQNANSPSTTTNCNSIETICRVVILLLSIYKAFFTFYGASVSIGYS